MSDDHRYTTAKLTITVKRVDSNPPIIRSSGIEGTVYENSAIGTKVVDSATGKPIHLTVTDADLVSIINHLASSPGPRLKVTDKNREKNTVSF